MEVALRKRDANSGAIEKRVDAVTEFTPHAAAVHRGSEAHPELQAEHERIVAEISGSYSNVVGLPMERLRDELCAWDAATRTRWP